MQHHFCEECLKIVPDNEVQDLNERFKIPPTLWESLQEAFQSLHGAPLNEPSFESGPRWHHVYTTIMNACGSSGMIGYYPVQETVWCGKVREPTDYEYFIYHTCRKTHD
jgi:hypothetical protein